MVKVTYGINKYPAEDCSLNLMFNSREGNNGLAFVGHLDTGEVSNPELWRFNPFQGLLITKIVMAEIRLI